MIRPYLKLVLVGPIGPARLVAPQIGMQDKLAIPVLLLLHRELLRLHIPISGKLLKLTVINPDLRHSYGLKPTGGALAGLGRLQEGAGRAFLWQGSRFLDRLAIACPIVQPVRANVGHEP